MKKQDYTMSLNEKMEMLRMGVRAVTRGYKTSRLIMGCLEESTQISIKCTKELYDIIIANQYKK